MLEQKSVVCDAPHGVLIRENPRDFPSFRRIFGHEKPIEIEIGCGKGGFLIARAVENPDIDFLGVDVVWKWMKYAVRRTEKRTLPNIKFLKTDARDLVRYGIPDDSVAVFHIYFPDPWPKRRHAKRRLVTGEFLKLLHSRLDPGGRIELSTDHGDYYLQMRRAVVQSGVEWSTVEEAVDARLFAAAQKTNYEVKYATAGRTLHYLELRK
jgi:tRNA (guanine-N7-)-methyltransferase